MRTIKWLTIKITFCGICWVSFSGPFSTSVSVGEKWTWGSSLRTSILQSWKWQHWQDFIQKISYYKLQLLYLQVLQTLFSKASLQRKIRTWRRRTLGPKTLDIWSRIVISIVPESTAVLFSRVFEQRTRPWCITSQKEHTQPCNNSCSQASQGQVGNINPSKYASSAPSDCASSRQPEWNTMAQTWRQRIRT